MAILNAFHHHYRYVESRAMEQEHGGANGQNRDPEK